MNQAQRSPDRMITTENKTFAGAANNCLHTAAIGLNASCARVMKTATVNCPPKIRIELEVCAAPVDAASSGINSRSAAALLGCVPSSTYHGPRRQPPNVTLSDRKGLPSSSFTNQSGCCWKRFDFSSAINGATQIAGSNPRARICFNTPCTFPPKAAPVSSQSPMAG